MGPAGCVTVAFETLTDPHCLQNTALAPSRAAKTFLDLVQIYIDSLVLCYTHFQSAFPLPRLFTCSQLQWAGHLCQECAQDSLGNNPPGTHRKVTRQKHTGHRGGALTLWAGLGGRVGSLRPCLSCLEGGQKLPRWRKGPASGKQGQCTAGGAAVPG